jgi:hypothetical protein
MSTQKHPVLKCLANCDWAGLTKAVLPEDLQDAQDIQAFFLAHGQKQYCDLSDSEKAEWHRLDAIQEKMLKKYYEQKRPDNARQISPEMSVVDLLGEMTSRLLRAESLLMDIFESLDSDPNDGERARLPGELVKRIDEFLRK